MPVRLAFSGEPKGSSEHGFPGTAHRFASDFDFYREHDRRRSYSYGEDHDHDEKPKYGAKMGCRYGKLCPVEPRGLPGDGSPGTAHRFASGLGFSRERNRRRSHSYGEDYGREERAKHEAKMGCRYG